MRKNYVYCEKSKETGNIIRFFSCFTWDYLLKQAMFVKPPEWKLWQLWLEMPNFKDVRANFCLIWVKNGKKLIIFNNFTLVSLS